MSFIEQVFGVTAEQVEQEVAQEIAHELQDESDQEVEDDTQQMAVSYFHLLLILNDQYIYC